MLWKIFRLCRGIIKDFYIRKLSCFGKCQFLICDNTISIAKKVCSIPIHIYFWCKEKYTSNQHRSLLNRFWLLGYLYQFAFKTSYELTVLIDYWVPLSFFLLFFEDPYFERSLGLMLKKVFIIHIRYVQ